MESKSLRGAASLAASKAKSFDSLRPETLKKLKAQNQKFNEELKVAAEDMEAYFIQQMLKEFRKNPFEEKGDELFPKGAGAEIYEDLRDEGMAKDMAKAGGIGLGKFVYEQMKRKIPGEKVQTNLINNKI